MPLKFEDFCPPVDAPTLLQFKGDAWQALQKSPPCQREAWLSEHELIGKLLEEAGPGLVTLDRRRG